MQVCVEIQDFLVTNQDAKSARMLTPPFTLYAATAATHSSYHVNTMFLSLFSFPHASTLIYAEPAVTINIGLTAILAWQ